MANNSGCSLSNDSLRISYELSIAAYSVATPVYFIVGLVSRIVCLIAFCRQYKKEKAFAYQILASLSDILEVIAVTLCMLTRNNLSGYRLPGALWYQKNYSLMWYAACLASPLEQAFITVSLLLSLSMAADRVFAIAKPFVYKSINHGRHQAVAASASFALGLSTSLFDIFRYQVKKNGDLYAIGVNERYVSANSAIGLAILRILVRIISNVALVCCNIAMVICYHFKTNKVSGSNGNEKRLAKKKSTQKTLLLLTICQSLFTTVDLTMFNIYYSLVYTSPSFTDCAGKLMAPIDDLTLLITRMLEFFALLAISKQFRNMILVTLSCKKVNHQTVVEGLQAAGVL